MNENIVVWTITIAIILLPLLIHFSNPLTDKEIETLATKRRNKAIRGYYDFNIFEYVVNADFKKKLNSSGEMYAVNDLLWEFPSITAALLKGKKHEWIIIGFERDKRIIKMWANKGFDNSSVNVPFTPEQIVEIAKQDDCLSVLIFHNHPNSNPQRYDCSMASNQDKITATQYANVLNAHGINLLEFVCERGQHHEFFLATPNSFMPIGPYLEDIRSNNGVSRGRNLNLRLEMIWGNQENPKPDISAESYGNRNTWSGAEQILAGILVLCFIVYPKALLIIVPPFLLMWLANKN